MSKRNLLVCFDAFGTLFTPRRPVAQQYAEVATSLGLRRFGEDEVMESFKKAFKNETRQHPNFGRKSGLGSEKWWTNIINNTFQPLVGQSQTLPPQLVPQLLHRFWSREGYALLPDAAHVLQRLQSQRENVVIGVITNSDDRVPDILSSLGLRVSPLRYGDGSDEVAGRKEDWDVDFSVMSYDVGHEKPDGRIFAAAEEMLGVVREERVEVDSWERVYVGDEYEKDVVGAVNAGWKAILIGQDQNSSVRWRDEEPAGDFHDLFGSSKSVGLSSLTKLAEWL